MAALPFKGLTANIVTVIVDVGRHVDGALRDVDRYVTEVWVGNQLKLGRVLLVQLLGVRIRALSAHTHTHTHTVM